jgi:hypothetical protein
MGFGSPSPTKQDKLLDKQQKAQAALARRDRISLLSEQLSAEDLLRLRMYGRRSMFSGGAGGGIGGIPLFGGNLGGALGGAYGTTSSGSSGGGGTGDGGLSHLL